MVKKMKYYAHSKAGQPVEQWQGLEEHLCQEAACIGGFLMMNSGWGWNMGFDKEIFCWGG